MYVLESKLEVRWCLIAVHCACVGVIYLWDDLLLYVQAYVDGCVLDDAISSTIGILILFMSGFSVVFIQSE